MSKSILVFCILLFGCVTTNITSNKSPGFNEKIRRLYVMERGSESAKLFFSSFNNYLGQSLKNRGVKTKFHHFEPLSLESEDDILQKVNEFGPNLLMVIQQTEGRATVNQYGWGTTNTGATFDIKLFKPDSKTPVWRANLKVDASFGLSESAKGSSDKLIEKLVFDKLL
ncbi:hypothetical protein [Flexithrix dorotheae]|uniref:hypothetical protein n=1 Tax=Flexithrix dorotheae TaxID=70993 RepID=UPI0012FA05BC|nr:hypothetical protein [Flexithrix dorotheae]